MDFDRPTHPGSSTATRDAPDSIPPSSFLTPFKATLLVLVDIYCNQPLLHASSRVVTPLLPFLIRAIHTPFALPRLTLGAIGQTLATIKVDTEANRGHAAFSDDEAMMPSGDSGWSVKDLLFDRLSELRNNDDFETFIVEMEDIIQFPGVELESMEDRMYLQDSSLLGVFVRRCYLAYKQLEFHEAALFFGQFQRYVAIAADDDDNGSGTWDGNTTGSNPKGLSEEITSALEAETFIDSCIERLAIPTLDALPDQTLVLLQRYRTMFPDLAKVHYANYLYHKQAGNYNEALQFLHRYFDYTGAIGERRLHQYALLSLASLEAQFHHYDQAARLIQEAVEVARENKDQACLSYASNWFYRLIELQPDRFQGQRANEQQLLESLTGKTRLLNLLHLQCLSELNKAKRALVAGESPATVFLALLRCELLQRQHRLPHITGTCYALWASVWRSYGFSHLAVLYAQLQVAYHIRDVASGDDALLGYCQIAQHLGDADQWAALAVLNDHIDTIRDPTLDRARSTWSNCYREQMLQSHALRGDWDSVGRLLPLLLLQPGQTNGDSTTAQQPPTGGDPGISKTARLVQAWLDIRREDYSATFHHLQSLLRVTAEPPNQRSPPPVGLALSPLEKVGAFRLMGEGLLETGVPDAALAYITQARELSSTAQFRADYLACSVLFIRALVALNWSSSAFDMCKALVSEIMTHGTPFVQGTFLRVYSECLPEAAGSAIKLSLLRQAHTIFDRLGCTKEKASVGLSIQNLGD
ncbi:hypothetical protein H4R33_006548 [Dimargaris cristalligena]|nr:hypothetical protein H4R33_006548 [Dimargaris cristalligena]